MTVCSIDHLPVDARLVTAPFSGGCGAGRAHQLLNVLHQRILLLCCQPAEHHCTHSRWHAAQRHCTFFPERQNHEVLPLQLPCPTKVHILTFYLPLPWISKAILRHETMSSANLLSALKKLQQLEHQQFKQHNGIWRFVSTCGHGWC